MCSIISFILLIIVIIITVIMHAFYPIIILGIVFVYLINRSRGKLKLRKYTDRTNFWHRKILILAIENNYRLTPSEVAIKLGISVYKSEQYLKILQTNKICNVVITDKGVILYNFPLKYKFLFNNFSKYRSFEKKLLHLYGKKNSKFSLAYICLHIEMSLDSIISNIRDLKKRGIIMPYLDKNDLLFYEFIDLISNEEKDAAEEIW